MGVEVTYLTIKSARAGGSIPYWLGVFGYHLRPFDGISQKWIKSDRNEV
jgi:hypothetical protein